MKHFSSVLAYVMMSVVAVPVLAQQIENGPISGSRYATDAYPGFDSDRDTTKPEKKEPRWFAWLNGPKMSNAVEQFDWAAALERAGSLSAARKAYDALVREWPASPLAAGAQLKVAELDLADCDLEQSFEEYRYMLDFYSMGCDYDAIAEKMYGIAGMMRAEGKTIMFFRFTNAVDVRRAYESLIVRAPGAAFVPKAMLTVAELREESGEYAEAIKVYENLRNIHPDTAEARVALVAEVRVRMKLLDEHGYNRARVKDTIDFLTLALRSEISSEDRAEIEAARAKAVALRAEEAWMAAKFYDSRTRTRRSAVNAYEKFIQDYPDSQHLEEARARLEVLKGDAQ